MSHEHDHTAGHPHVHRYPPRRDQDDTLTYYRAMEAAVRELLIEKGVFTADDVRRQVENMDGRNAGRGAQMVAHAWLDPAYKQRMLADGSKAAEEIGLDVGPLKLVVVENTPSVHNVIVCTLCSCYPRMLLGLPPDWYKSRNYRSRVVREPRAVLAEFGTVIPEDMSIRVHDSTADMRYSSCQCGRKEPKPGAKRSLASLVTRDSMIGVAMADRASR